MWRGKASDRVENTREVYGLNLDCLLVSLALLNWAVPSWQVDTIIYSSVQGHFTDWQIRLWTGGDSWQWGFGSVVQLLRLCLLSVVSEQHPIKSQLCHSGFSESERKKKKKKVWGQRENRRKRRGRVEGRSDELSVAWEGGRAQGYDWLQARSEFKANAQARARCKVGRKGGCGAQRGACKQERQVLVKESLKKKEKKKKTLWKDSATKWPGLCGALFLQMLAINLKIHHASHTQLKMFF